MDNCLHCRTHHFLPTSGHNHRHYSHVLTHWVGLGCLVKYVQPSSMPSNYTDAHNVVTARASDSTTADWADHCARYKFLLLYCIIVTTKPNSNLFHVGFTAHTWSIQTLFQSILNISGKYHQNRSSWFRAIPFQSWHVFLRHSVYVDIIHICWSLSPSVCQSA